MTDVPLGALLSAALEDYDVGRQQVALRASKSANRLAARDCRGQAYTFEEGTEAITETREGGDEPESA